MSDKKDLDYYMNLPWNYRFEWSDEDQCYVASVAELKGCMSHGETLMEAASMIIDALKSYISCALQYGDEITEPVKPSEFKGKITYRTTPEKHYKLAKKSAVSAKSINKIIDEAVIRFPELVCIMHPSSYPVDIFILKSLQPLHEVL